MRINQRIGQFLFLLGLGLLVFFGFSDVAQTPRYSLFFWGLIALIVGIMMIQRNRPAPKESGRFSTMKSILTTRSEKEKDE